MRNVKRRMENRSINAAACCLLPTAYCFLPTAFLLPVTQLQPVLHNVSREVMFPAEP
jgi:hypothetical protein